MNGMRFIDVKNVIDFMYRGEVKIIETDLDKILAVAESLQVKGLCNVRNEKKEETKVKVNEELTGCKSNRCRKRRKIDHKTLENSDPLLFNELDLEKNGFSHIQDDDLSEKINIKSPIISDIDDPNGTYLSNTSSTTTRTIPKILIRKPIQSANIKTYSRTLIREQGAPERMTKLPPTEKVPRPPNAFMIFANEWRKVLARENPKDSNKDISVRLGKKWKNLTMEVKENYYTAAKKADEEHKIKYPGYFYSPKEARIRKNMNNSRATYVRRSSSSSLDAMDLCKLVMPEETAEENHSGGNKYNLEQNLISRKVQYVETETSDGNETKQTDKVEKT